MVVLTDQNFSDFVARNEYVMMNFYMHNCKWCRKLAPEYAAAATMLKGKAVLAKIDPKETKLAIKFKVSQWPTLYLLIGGGAHKGKDSEELSAVSKLHIDVSFYQTANVDAANLFYQKIKRPTLVLVKREGLTPIYFGYEGQFTRLAMGDFISKRKLPSVIPYTVDNAQRIYNNRMKQLWLFAPEGSWDVISIFEEAEKSFKGKLLFVHVETSHKDSYIRNLCHQLGIIEGSPTVVAFHKADKDIKNYKYDGELTLSGIKSFAEDFLEEKFLSKLEPAMNSSAA
ncbi:hypothetical protein P3X46_025392 [Hevea brasiliensis]|uniref:Thioredoxin domain-containing protein n=1 Tax=Hevea brasiliensis TaxID=3981 RepID=A0ABQ9L5M1_HEVBR|nr:hypothetical protein P3X46_025392 [Hevea brasiliensis]